MNKKPTEVKATEYDMRCIAIKLAIQHSRNCHSDTLIKLADRIYDFISGKPYSKKFGNNE